MSLQPDHVEVVDASHDHLVLHLRHVVQSDDETRRRAQEIAPDGGSQCISRINHSQKLHPVTKNNPAVGKATNSDDDFRAVDPSSRGVPLTSGSLSHLLISPPHSRNVLRITDCSLTTRSSRDSSRSTIHLLAGSSSPWHVCGFLQSLTSPLSFLGLPDFENFIYLLLPPISHCQSEH